MLNFFPSQGILPMNIMKSSHLKIQHDRHALILPLKKCRERAFQDPRVICFDDFHVHLHLVPFGFQHLLIIQTSNLRVN
ncbi:hypothetical protein NC651_015799 [Populus alba x Populus x berolinensis]|nr:hypothetical protein NC651_015799 [Populus alba x Populus x berolinensis]